MAVLKKWDDYQCSSEASSKAHLSQAFSTITFEKIIFLKRSEGGQRPTKQSICRGCKEKVLLTPLYYPDTLVNPDICLSLGISKRRIPGTIWRIWKGLKKDWPSLISDDAWAFKKVCGRGSFEYLLSSFAQCKVVLNSAPKGAMTLDTSLWKDRFATWLASFKSTADLYKTRR